MRYDHLWGQNNWPNRPAESPGRATNDRNEPTHPRTDAGHDGTTGFARFCQLALAEGVVPNGGSGFDSVLTWGKNADKCLDTWQVAMKAEVCKLNLSNFKKEVYRAFDGTREATSAMERKDDIWHEGVRDAVRTTLPTGLDEVYGHPQDDNESRDRSENGGRIGMTESDGCPDEGPEERLQSPTESIRPIGGTPPESEGTQSASTSDSMSGANSGTESDETDCRPADGGGGDHDDCDDGDADDVDGQDGSVDGTDDTASAPADVKVDDVETLGGGRLNGVDNGDAERIGADPNDEDLDRNEGDTDRNDRVTGHHDVADDRGSSTGLGTADATEGAGVSTGKGRPSTDRPDADREAPARTDEILLEPTTEIQPPGGTPDDSGVTMDAEVTDEELLAPTEEIQPVGGTPSDADDGDDECASERVQITDEYDEQGDDETDDSVPGGNRR